MATHGMGHLDFLLKEDEMRKTVKMLVKKGCNIHVYSTRLPIMSQLFHMNFCAVCPLTVEGGWIRIFKLFVTIVSPCDCTQLIYKSV